MLEIGVVGFEEKLFLPSSTRKDETHLVSISISNIFGFWVYCPGLGFWGTGSPLVHICQAQACFEDHTPKSSLGVPEGYIHQKANPSLSGIP